MQISISVMLKRDFGRNTAYEYIRGDKNIIIIWDTFQLEISFSTLGHFCEQAISELPFPPLIQSESQCKAFHMEISFIHIVNEPKFACE